MPAPEDRKRWIFQIDQYARISVPEMWDRGHYPVRHTSLSALGIDPSKLKFQPVTVPVAPVQKDFGTIIAQARMQIAQAIGVKPEAVRIIIEG